MFNCISYCLKHYCIKYKAKSFFFFKENDRKLSNIGASYDIFDCVTSLFYYLQWIKHMLQTEISAFFHISIKKMTVFVTSKMFNYQFSHYPLMMLSTVAKDERFVDSCKDKQCSTCQKVNTPLNYIYFQLELFSVICFS